MIRLPYTLGDTINNRILAGPQRWLGPLVSTRRRGLVIVGVALLALLLPQVVPWYYWPYIVALFAGLATMVTVMRWPPLGLVALIVTALVVPSPRLPGGLNVSVLMVGLLFGLWLLNLVMTRRTNLVPSRTVKPLLVFIAISCLAFVFGQMPWFGSAPSAPISTQLGGLAIFVLSAGLFLVVAHQVRDLRWLEWMTWLYLALASIHVLGWLLPSTVGFIGSKLQEGATSNSMFWLWTVALSLSQALLNRKMTMPARLVLAALAVVTMYVAYSHNSGWKSGYLPVLVAAGTIIAARSWRLMLLMALASIVPLQFLLTEAISTDEYSYLTRIDAWIVILDMVKISPFFGFGPANYHWYTPFFSIRGFNIRFNSHNQYLDIIAQVGFLGMAAFAWFAWELGRVGWRLRERAPEGFAKAYVYGALGGLIGTLVAGMLVDWFLPFVYNIGLNGFRGSLLSWLFLGGLVSIEQIVRGQGSTPAPGRSSRQS